MIMSTFSDLGEEQKSEAPLSDETEREILEMVERQLDRPNPPDTTVLYRRAMHFIDRDVRHLSLQQFNAKFPLQVKRRRAKERADARTSRSSRGPRTGEAAAAPTGRSDGREGRSGKERLRERLRCAMIDYAKRVAGAEGRGELVEAVPRVEEYVERALEGG